MRRFVKFLIPVLFAVVPMGLLVAAQSNAIIRSRIERLGKRALSEFVLPGTALTPEVMS